MKKAPLLLLLLLPSLALGQTQKQIRDTALSQSLELISEDGGQSVKTNEPSIADYLKELDYAKAQKNTEMRSQMLAKGRSFDPFGTAMRGNLKDEPVSAQKQAAAKDDAASQRAVDAPTGFEQAVHLLTIGAVDATRKEFLIGSDNIYEGDAFDMQYRAQTFRVWVKAVADDIIVLMDQQTQSIVEIPLSFQGRKYIKGDWGAGGAVSRMPQF